ncbi:MAG: hypothetical protein ACOX6E_03350 [Syntrophomonadaceae bacterium]|jgi:hypothetical protein
MEDISSDARVHLEELKDYARIQNDLFMEEDYYYDEQFYEMIMSQIY